MYISIHILFYMYWYIFSTYILYFTRYKYISIYLYTQIHTNILRFMMNVFFINVCAYMNIYPYICNDNYFSLIFFILPNGFYLTLYC